MLIRSQYKTSIINLDCVKEIFIDVDNNIAAYSNGINSYLGTYSTVEKAIKVLDRIMVAYETMDDVFVMPQDSEV